VKAEGSPADDAGGRGEFYEDLTPDEKARRPRERPPLAAARREAVEALEAVRDAHQDCRGCLVCDCANAFLHTLQPQESLINDDLFDGREEARDGLLARRRPHPDPLRRVLLALRGLERTADDVMDRHAGCTSPAARSPFTYCDFHGHAWAIAWPAHLYANVWDGAMEYTPEAKAPRVVGVPEGPGGRRGAGGPQGGGDVIVPGGPRTAPLLLPCAA
jgi:hypothetical protein